MKEKFLIFLNQRWVQCWIIVLAFITAIIPIVGSVFKSGVDCDSAYYISIAERITEGFVPYKTIHVGYTPLFLYILAGFKCLLQIPNGCYWPYLLLHFLFEIGTSYFVYAIARQFGAKKMVAIFGAWLNIMMLHWFGGNVVLLEVPSLFFGLASSLLVLCYKGRNAANFLWIGCLTTCAFLCKQFGLGFVLLNLYLMITVNRQSLKACGLFLLGCTIPITLCFVIWGLDFMPLIFSGYGTKTAVEAGYDASFANKINNVVTSMLYFCYMACVAVFVGILSFFHAAKSGHFWKLLFGYCGIVGFSLQFLFAGGYHYMMFMVPFACLVITEMLSIKEMKLLEILKVIAVSWVVFVNLYKVYYNRVYKQYVKNDVRAAQYELTGKIKEFVSPGDAVWVAHTALYYLVFTTDVLPPNIHTIGYSFGPLGINENKAFQQAKNADWIVCFSESDPYDRYFTDSLQSFIEQYPLVAQYNDSTILLYSVPKN